ncbi:hypothetical protein F5Y04DRAFT_282924 [Hypomontagnella monticulosa]|nr:hypothetical protein F5Y04DRAFT_282924 [Hypomontagnella monticulosa]
MLPASKRKQRVVLSCTPCYSKKQKCNRQHPCNHCIRRRRTEECTYTFKRSPSPSRRTSTASGQGSIIPYNQKLWVEQAIKPSQQPLSPVFHGERFGGRQQAPLADLFGYFHGNESNTLGLLQQVYSVQRHAATILTGVPSNIYQFNIGDTSPDQSSRMKLSGETLDAVQSEMEHMLARPILDFLLDHFISEVNWINQLLHPPSFLRAYGDWWARGAIDRIIDVEFAILILRICTYSSQFLPSPSHTVDMIRGMPLTEIRSQCGRIARALEHICIQVDPIGSLVRVQHLCFAALNQQCEGNMKVAWMTFNSAIGISQMIGIHEQPACLATHEISDFEIEMRRRIFYNLYIWDARPPFVSDEFCAANLPKAHQMADIEKGGAPETFMERALQVRLAQFWNSKTARGEVSVPYDPNVAEERYEAFCTEFLASIPAPFAIDANVEWDDIVPNIKRQRQLFHVAVYRSICSNFRPLLQLEPAYISSLPKYKQAILHQQRRTLTRAALCMLQAITNLHTLLGSTHTRLSDVVFHTFEAAVILSCLCLVGEPSGMDDGESTQDSLDDEGLGFPAFFRVADPMASKSIDIHQQKCVNAVKEAYERLQMLADVNVMAEAGSTTLSTLLERIGASTSPKEVSSHATILGNALVTSNFQPTHPDTELRDDEVPWPTIMGISDINLSFPLRDIDVDFGSFQL